MGGPASHRIAILLGGLSLVGAALGFAAFATTNPLPPKLRSAVGFALGAAAVFLGFLAWRDQRLPDRIRTVGLFSWILGLALVISGAILLAIQHLMG